MEKKVLKFLILFFGFIVLLPFFPEQLSLTNGFFTTSSYAVCRCRCDEISQVCLWGGWVIDYIPDQQCHHILAGYSSSKVCEPTDRTVRYRNGDALEPCGCYDSGSYYPPSSFSGSALWDIVYSYETKYSCEHVGGQTPSCY